MKDKEAKLDDDRQNFEAELMKRVEALRTQIGQEVGGAQQTKLLVACAVSVLLGLLVSQFVLRTA